MSTTNKNKGLFEKLAPILLVCVLALTFAVGVLWQKISSLEKTTKNQFAANNPQPAAPQDEPQAGDVDPVGEGDYIRGNKNAKIALIEYSDTECPFCKTFHETAKNAIKEYEGNLMWVYRHFPLDTLHPKARKQAEALECAGKLGGNDSFWKLLDKIFEVTPANNGLDNNTLPDLAKSVGLNKTTFKTCLDSGETADKVEADYQSGIKAGVRGTPGNILLDTQTGKARVIPGAVPYQQLKQAIDEMLGKSN